MELQKIHMDNTFLSFSVTGLKLSSSITVVPCTARVSTMLTMYVTLTRHYSNDRVADAKLVSL